MASTESRIAAQGGSIHEHRKATRKMRWWYEAMADFMMANPNATQNEIAANFNRAVGTVSTIINSDAFKAYLRQRRSVHVEALDQSVRTKMLTVADRGFDLILDRFDKKRDSIPLETIQKLTETALKASGYGQLNAPGVSVTVNAPTTVPVSVSLADLQAAQQALRNAQSHSLAPPIEGEFTEVIETSTALEDLA